MPQVLDQLHRFMSINITVGPGVLVPRAETELLGQAALDILAEIGGPAIVIDMCCGSGNLGLAIADRVRHALVFSSDLTDETVSLARLNAQRLGLSDRVRVGQGDMFAGIDLMNVGLKADLIVCNPPYISASKLESERAYLLDKEPREAFDAGPYGIAIHQRLISEAPKYLKSGGWLAFEFGEGQDRQVNLLLRRSGHYARPEFACNAKGIPRVAIAEFLE